MFLSLILWIKKNRGSLLNLLLQDHYYYWVWWIMRTKHEKINQNQVLFNTTEVTLVLNFLVLGMLSSSLRLRLFYCAHVWLSVSRMANFGAQGPGATDCVTKVAISVSCDNLLDMDAFSKSDPLCVLSLNSSGPHWCEVRRSNRMFFSWLQILCMFFTPVKMYIPLNTCGF